MARGCGAEAHALLDFYVNGTLGEEERAGVDEHLAGCAVCAREVAEIREVARSASEAGSDVLTPPRRRPRLPGLVYVAAAALTGLLAFWVVPRSPSALPLTVPEQAPPPLLDLGAGAARGATPRTFRLPAGSEYLDVRFIVPWEPGAAYEVVLRGPSGERRFGPVEIGGWDGFGRATQRFPAAAFEPPGERRLEVRELSGSGARPPYEFSFRVERSR